MSTWFGMTPEHLIGLVTVLVLAASSLCLLLAAGAIGLRMKNALVAARWERSAVEWEPLVLEVLAGELPPESLLARVTPRDAEFFLDYLARFGRHLKGVELDRIEALARPFLGEILADLRAASAETRARALHLLGVLGGAANARHLLRALDDPAPLVGLTAARALTRHLEPSHVEAVVANLHRFRHWRPAFLSAMLAALGADAAPVLRWALGDRNVPAGVRAVVADALAQLADAAASDVAAAIADRESDPELLAACLRLLARAGHGDHLPPVRRLANSPQPIIRIAAYRALAVLAEAADAPLLERGLADSSIWVAEHAARGLAASPWRERLRGLDSADPARLALAREALAEAGF
ncbi:MAG: HEAT repeat domain-containing protein [Gemmatimonadales bacterium]